MNAPLTEQLERLPAELRATLAEYHFDAKLLGALARRLRGEVEHTNLVSGALAPCAPADIGVLPEPNSEAGRALEAEGLRALRNGECALVVMAGGMATRMGGIVKALAEALPGNRFLDLRLAETATLERRAGRRVPLWLMTSHATEHAIKDALGTRFDPYFTTTFPQFVSLRLTPSGELFRDPSTGQPSLTSPGHGDLPDALRASGLLDRFIAAGGKTISVANIDNLGASLDPLIIGYHLAHGKPVTCEVVDKLGTDRGGIPVALNGRPVVLEEFRIPPSFDPESVRVFNTNTFHLDARALASLQMEWTYFTVEKRVEGQTAIQFERLINELTSVLDTNFLHAPRIGEGSRFLPVKDPEELERRQGEITLVARNRGMI